MISLKRVINIIICGFVLISMYGIPIGFQLLLYAAFVIYLLIAYERKGPLYPLSWFGVFYFLYSASFPAVSVLLGLQSDSLCEVLPISFVGFFGFLVGVILIPVSDFVVPTIRANVSMLKFVLLMTVVGCFGVLYLGMQLEGDSKRSVVDYMRSAGIDKSMYMFWFLTILYIVYCVKCLQVYRLKKWFFVLHNSITYLVFMILILAYGVFGERDLLYRLALLMFLVVTGASNQAKYSWWHYPVIIILALVTLPVLQEGKCFLQTGSFEDIGIPSFISILNGEFASAGKNLFIVIEYKVAQGADLLLLSEIRRVLDFLFPGGMSAVQWYNSLIRPSLGMGGTSGWGFSFVADALIRFGIVGVFFEFLFIGMFSAFLCRMAIRHVYAFIFYLLYIPATIYCIRADLVNFINMVFKVNLLIVILFVGVDVVMHGMHMKTAKNHKT